jgi:hypothetical protein
MYSGIFRALSEVSANATKVLWHTLRRLNNQQRFALLMTVTVVIGVTSIVSLMLLILSLPHSPMVDGHTTGSPISGAVAMVVGSAAGSMAVAGLLFYLRTPFGEYGRAKRTILIESEVLALQQSRSRRDLQQTLVSDDERKAILAKVEARLEETISENAIKSFEAKFSDRLVEQLRLNRLAESCQSTRDRLLNEIESLERRGNVNLAFGSVATVVGLVLLGFFVFFNQSPQADGATMAAYSISRALLVIFIQVFGFFFLRLYRASLEGIKYFHNELTNVEVRYAALEIAVGSANPKMLSSIIVTLAKTERNFVLSKGQTTVDLERAKLDGASDMTIREIVHALGARARKPHRSPGTTRKP